MGKEWAAANLTAPVKPSTDGSSFSMRQLAATQARMAGAAKKMKGGVTTSLGFLATAANSAAGAASGGRLGSRGARDAEPPAQHDWVDPLSKDGGFRPSNRAGGKGGKGRGRGHGRGRGGRGEPRREDSAQGQLEKVDKALSTHRIAV